MVHSPGMNADLIAKLNTEFCISGALSFSEGAGGFVFANLSAGGASVELCLYGAHVTSYVPEGEEPVIWMSPDAMFRKGKAIRGGIPICWPWFLAHPTDPEQPSHGTARISQWEVVGAERLEDGGVCLRLALPGELACELAVTLGASLKLELTTSNGTGQPLLMSEALHSYFQVGDISQVTLSGLEGVSYLDTVDGFAEKVENEAISISEEVDRRYHGTAAEVLIRDEALGRTIRVAKMGSATTVVWNPWIDKAKGLGDFPDDGYETMVCVEAANCGLDEFTLAAGEVRVLGTEISLV